MKKNFKLYAICWAILLALFNVIVFVSPAEAMGLSKFGGAFWAGYLFITLAFIGQLVCAFFAFKADSAKKFFYRIPLITISYTALLLVTAAGAVCMAIPGLPNWVGIVVCFAIVAFSAVSVIGAKAAEEAVVDMDEKIKGRTLFIKSLTVDAQGLASRAKSDVVKAEAKKIYEAVRYSDPMSSEGLTDLEAQITLQFAAFSDAVAADDGASAKAVADELLTLIGDRNNRCKLLKS